MDSYVREEIIVLDDTRNKNVVITGATGVIGMALIEKLLFQYQCQVWVLTSAFSARKDRLEQFKSCDRFHVLEAELEEYGELKTEAFGRKMDIFFHMAWDGSVTSKRHDIYRQQRNIKYTLDAVNLAARIGCEVFVGAGSQSEYGRSPAKMTSKTPTNPESAYGTVKLCAGALSRLECKRLGIRHIWMRVLSVYGPYCGEDAVLIDSILKMLRGEKTVFSKGEQIWDFLYSEDAAEAFWRAALYGRDGAIYPLGCGQEVRLVDYIKKLVEVVQPEAEVEIGGLPYAPNQNMYLCADLRELTEDTGFVPKVGFEEGIRRTVEMFSQNI